VILGVNLEEIMTFETWFRKLTDYAALKGMSGIINADDPESYRDHFDDGISPQDAYGTEFSYWADDA
jgi:hypothetical protein